MTLAPDSPQRPLARTSQFVQFLRDAAAIKTRPVSNVANYPTVVWFSELPRLAEIRSPLLTTEWSADDERWLAVARVPEPDRPAPPDGCRPWLDGVNLDELSSPPALNAWRETQDAQGMTTREVPPPPAQSAWGRYRLDWDRWAAKARVARAIRPIYQKLFAAHQELQGRADAFDVFIGVGLMHARAEGMGVVRRHLLAFPAELSLDDRTGTISVGPSPDFMRLRVETDFLAAAERARLHPALASLESEFNEVGPGWHDRIRMKSLLTRLVVPFDALAQYDDSVSPVDAQPGSIRVCLAPALIVRPRSTRSLQELLERIERQTSGPDPEVTADRLPLGWRKMMEDDSAWDQAEAHHAEIRRGVPPGRVYFPLPSNDEQSRIVRFANSASPGVVVQGPPGTGKSHTIANLIAHYLASGQRVLVTAETTQALEVLHDKLPSSLGQLCVSLLGDSRAGQQKLKDDVDVVLNRLQRYHPERAEREIEKLERQLVEGEAELNRLERTLHQARVAETQQLEPVQGYRGTRSAIARRLRDERARFEWTKDAIPHTVECPTFEYGWERLADYHQSLNEEARAVLARFCSELPFKPAEALAVLEAIQNAKDGIPFPLSEAVPALPQLPVESLEALDRWLSDLQKVEGTIAHDDRPWSAELRSVLLRPSAAWDALRTEARQTLVPLTDDVIKAIVPVEVTGRSPAEARRDLARLHQHYEAGGGRRAYLLFKPAVIRECEWVETGVTVDGLLIRTPSDVDRARRVLDGKAALDRAWNVWNRWPAVRHGSPIAEVAALRQRLQVLDGLLASGQAAQSLPDDSRAWLETALVAAVATRELRAAVSYRLKTIVLADARKERDEMLGKLRDACGAREVVTSIVGLHDALEREDVHAANAALRNYADEVARRAFQGKYLEFIGQVTKTAPQLGGALRAGEGTAEWRDAFLTFESAWTHHRARTWLAIVLSAEKVEALHRAARDQRQRCQDLLARLATEKAWHHALGRLDDRRRAGLVAWASAVARIPKTGRTVFRRRAEAQRLLGHCLDSIPAWVVSLGRLYETVQGAPGMFDVAIVDEASQCWLDSLILFYLAKRVIIVGDDKQISPTIVAVKADEIHALAQAYLRDLQYGSLFTLESSLFDHARRYLSASVPLREHFRCVPEIIRFSNELCYAQNPLIPLRQVSRDRLEPLKRTYLPDGLRVGDINEREAEAIVDAIGRCHADAAYDEDDFGVICLQGEAQGQRIEQMLLERVGIEVFRKRRLRCGNPYVFQGDERDVMFISMVAAPNAQQAALTTPMYQQRFNVAMSRARNQAWLFHSIQEDEIGPHCLRRRVLGFFKEPPNLRIYGASLDIPTLQRAAVRADRLVERPPVPFDSWFEVDVALALTARGFALSSQVEVAGRFIDLVVEGDEGARLAVECDGEAWHGAEQYEEDMHRQRQLERAEWTFVRVRESLFYADESKAVAEVVAACEELGIEPGGGRAESDEAMPRELEPGLEAAMPSTVATIPGEALEGDGKDAAVGDTESPLQAELSYTEANNPPDDDESATESWIPAGASRRGPFTGYSDRQYPDPRTAPVANIRDAVLDIVTRDGPLPKESIYRLYRDGCPRVEKAGRYLRQAVNRAVYALERSGQVACRDEGKRRLAADVVVALPSQELASPRPAGARKLEDVPLAEIAALMVTLSAAVRPASEYARVDLYKRVGSHYGIRRLTTPTIHRLRRAEASAFGESGAAQA